MDARGVLSFGAGRHCESYAPYRTDRCWSRCLAHAICKSSLAILAEKLAALALRKRSSSHFSSFSKDSALVSSGDAAQLMRGLPPAGGAGRIFLRRLTLRGSLA